MINTIGDKNKKTKLSDNQNTIESLKGFDKFFTDNQSEFRKYEESYGRYKDEKKPVQRKQSEFSIFNYQKYYEQSVVNKEIKQLHELITKEIELIKKSNSALLQEVKDVEKLTLESLPEKPGIYHVRFFEIILSILRSLRAKIGESRTWLTAMISKKKKRGSLFAVRSKKQGTLYSLSQELQSARSIQ